MTPAPPFDCASCGRRIGKRATHHLIGEISEASTDRLLCIRCLSDRSLHDRYWPDCPERWHDMYDHPSHFASRAAAAHLLGLWP